MKCEFCNKSFEAKKSDSKYCTPTCRKYAYIERERRNMGWSVPDTYTSYRNKRVRISEPHLAKNPLGIDIKGMANEMVKNIFDQSGLSSYIKKE